MSAATSAAHSSVIPAVRIEPTRGWTSLRLRDVWQYRELLYFLVWRDAKVQRPGRHSLGADRATLVDRRRRWAPPAVARRSRVRAVRRAHALQK